LGALNSSFVCLRGQGQEGHGRIALDSKNDLYVSEVTWTFAVSRDRAPEDCHTGT
jgi:hypothetical protein